MLESGEHSREDLKDISLGWGWGGADSTLETAKVRALRRPVCVTDVPAQSHVPGEIAHLSMRELTGEEAV